MKHGKDAPVQQLGTVEPKVSIDAQQPPLSDPPRPMMGFWSPVVNISALIMQLYWMSRWNTTQRITEPPSTTMT